jgi:hypothetical protein
MTALSGFLTVTGLPSTAAIMTSRSPPPAPDVIGGGDWAEHRVVPGVEPTQLVALPVAQSHAWLA